MEIYKGTGVLKTGELKSTKSIGALLLTSTRSILELTNETITVWIERVNRGNVYLATAVPLQDFIALTAFGADSIQTDGENALIALCELCPDGKGLHLNEGESLRFKLEALSSTSTYGIYGIEEPETTYDFYKFDRKTVASEDEQRRLSVDGNELVIFNTNSVVELMVGYGNGVAVKYLPFELRVISRDIDPVFSFKGDDLQGTVIQGITGKILLPVFGIEFIEFQKTTGTLISMTSRTDFNLLEVE